MAGDFAERRVVTGDIEIADRVVVDGRRAVDQRHELAVVLHLLDGRYELIRISRQDDQCINALHRQILHCIRLACRIGRRLDDDVQALVLGHQKLGDTFGMEHNASRPAVVGGRNGNADRHLLCLLGKSRRRHRHGKCRQRRCGIAQ
ncbi:hypothetical protein D3C80_1065750 [compost metagenome]